MYIIVRAGTVCWLRRGLKIGEDGKQSCSVNTAEVELNGASYLLILPDDPNGLYEMI